MLEPAEALAVRFAEKVATDYRSVDSSFKAELREQFSTAQVVELSMMIGQYISFGRQLVMLGIGKGACEIYTTGD